MPLRDSENVQKRRRHKELTGTLAAWGMIIHVIIMTSSLTTVETVTIYIHCCCISMHNEDTDSSTLLSIKEDRSLMAVELLLVFEASLNKQET